MLTTQSDYIDFEVSDSTVRVFPGAVRLGSMVTVFRGGQIQVAEMAKFTDQSSYQWSALCIIPSGEGSDMTNFRSDPASSVRELAFPVLPDETSVKPVGLFELYTGDGTSVSLISSYRVS